MGDDEAREHEEEIDEAIGHRREGEARKHAGRLQVAVANEDRGDPSPGVERDEANRHVRRSSGGPRAWEVPERRAA